MYSLAQGCCALLLALFIFAGCASNNSVTDLGLEGSVILESVPYYPQKAYQCGPASLAMLLGASGLNVSPDDLVSQVYIPDRRGSLQVELIAACRRWKRIPYIISPNISAILGEIQNGRPVLVFQNLGLNILPAYHYAVIVGVLTPDKIVLRSGSTESLVVDINDFVKTWTRTDSWGVVALRPGELPYKPSKFEYLKSVRDFELVGNVREATLGYSAARSLWPDDRSVLFAQANNFLVLKEYADAEKIYQELISRDTEDIAALNNLGETLSLKGCNVNALSYIDQGIEIARKIHSPLLQSLQQTRSEITQRDTVAPVDGTVQCDH